MLRLVTSGDVMLDGGGVQKSLFEESAKEDIFGVVICRVVLLVVPAYLHILAGGWEDFFSTGRAPVNVRVSLLVMATPLSTFLTWKSSDWVRFETISSLDIV